MIVCLYIKCSLFVELTVLKLFSYVDILGKIDYIVCNKLFLIYVANVGGKNIANYYFSYEHRF